MSTAAELINGLGAQGITFRVEEDRLIVRGPKGLIDQQTLAELRNQKPQLIAELSDAARERRRQQLHQMMAADDQGKKYFYVTDTDADPEFVILARAIRDGGISELKIPREKYDPFLLMEALRKIH